MSEQLRRDRWDYMIGLIRRDRAGPYIKVTSVRVPVSIYCRDHLVDV